MSLGIQIAGKHAVSFIIKCKNNTVEFHTDIVFPEPVVSACLFNGTACNGNIPVIHISMSFFVNALSVITVKYRKKHGT